MKKIHTPENVAHLFAHQSQTEASNSSRTLYFYDDIIFSYGKHFPIAKHVKQGEKEALLFTTRSYSVSTAKHINIVRNAVNHLNKIYCPVPTDSVSENIKAFEGKIKLILSNLATAKKPAKYILEAENVFYQACKYAEFFKVNVKSISKLIEAAKSGKYAEQLIKERKAKAKRDNLALKRQQKEFSIQLEKWRTFEVNSLSGRVFDIDYLRFNSELNRVETSQGVQIPVEIAKKFYTWLKSVNTCVNCNEKLMQYSVKEITKDYVLIGCHKVLRSEIETLATKLNF